MNLCSYKLCCNIFFSYLLNNAETRKTLVFGEIGISPGCISRTYKLLIYYTIVITVFLVNIFIGILVTLFCFRPSKYPVILFIKSLSLSVFNTMFNRRFLFSIMKSI